MRVGRILEGTLSALAAPWAVPASSAQPSVMRVIDAASAREVILVGTMHYNPHSIATVETAIRDAAASGGLHAAAIELCDARWSSDVARKWNRERSLRRVLSEDEFQVAFEAALDCGLGDVVLADQPVAESGRRLAVAVARTVADALSPAGWRRIGDDGRLALSQLPAFGAAALDRRILAGTPLAVARYAYSSPAALPLAGLSAAALALAAAVDEATGAVAGVSDGAVTALAAVVLGRAGFIALIEERNQVLAGNIREACLQPPQHLRGGGEAEDAAGAGAAVVAVLGMAHLEGVRAALLVEQ